MKIQSILMVEPRSPANHVFTRFALPRLGLPILVTIAARKGYGVRIVFEEIAPLDLREVDRVDLLCISTITPTAERAYEIAERARAHGVPVVLGGPHSTALPLESINHADWVIRGEAERAFPQFLDTLAHDGDLSAVPGLVYRRGNDILSNDLDPVPICLDEIPAPDFNLIVGRDPRRFQRGVIPVATSRGCPHKCQFCSVTSMFGRMMRHASVEHVADELERHRGQGDVVFFYDDNFCASPRRTKELLDHLLTKEVFLPPWIAQVSVRAARDPELLQMMERAGCHTVCVGFESINPGALALYRKRQNLDDIKGAIHRFHKHNINVHGMFVFGSDAEDVDTIRATADFAIAKDIESVQFLVLTPLPGTPLFDQLNEQGRLLTTDWSLYDTHHTVFLPERITPYALMDETLKAMSKVYALKRTLHHLIRGKVQRATISLYAAGQVNAWRRENRRMMRKLRQIDRAGPSFPASPKNPSALEMVPILRQTLSATSTP